MGHVFASGALLIILGGNYSIGFATVRGIAQQTDKKIGITHFDRDAKLRHRLRGCRLRAGYRLAEARRIFAAGDLISRALWFNLNGKCYS